MPFPKLPGEERTHDALLDPQIGDLFSEMPCFRLYIVDRNDNEVITCEGSPPCTMPDDGTWNIYTVEELRERLSYKSISGYWALLYSRGNMYVTTWQCPIEYHENDGELAPFGWLPV